MGKSGDEDTATFGHGDTGARGQLDVGHADTGSVGHGGSGTPGQRDAVPRGRGHSGPTRCPPFSPAAPPLRTPRARPRLHSAQRHRVSPAAGRDPHACPVGFRGAALPPPPAPPALFSAAGYFRCGGAASRHGDTRCRGGVSAGTARPCGPAPPAAESRPGTGRPTRVGRRRGSTCGSGPALPHAGRDRRRLRSGGAMPEAEYHRLEDPEEDSPPGEEELLLHVTEGRQGSWHHIKNLDDFFTKIYHFHQKNGFTCMLLSDLFELGQFVFVVAFSAFLLCCVRYDVLFADRPLNRSHVPPERSKVTLPDAVLPAPQCARRIAASGWLVFLLAMAALFWLCRLLKVLRGLLAYWDIRRFYGEALRIPAGELCNYSWQEVQARLIALQREQQLCVHKRELTELDIHHRILRFSNYTVAMVNKSLLPVRFRLPLLGPVVFLTQGLHYNLELLLFRGPGALFLNSWSLRPCYKRAGERLALARRLARSAALLGAANLLLCPLVLVWQLLYAFFSYAEVLRRRPGVLGTRRWSLYGRLYLRHFNELQHELAARLGRGHRPATRYMNSFASPVLAVLARHVAFFAGSVLAVLIALTVYDEDVLTVQHILTAITLLGLLLTVARSFIPDEHSVQCPEQLLQRVLAHTHYMPQHWQGSAGAAETRNEMAQLFQYKAVFILEELLSPILTPLILIFALPSRALDIVDFFRNFTVEVVGVGDVCSFAQLDVRRHGNPQWLSEGQTEASVYQRAENGKTELSLMHFAISNPRWQPPPHSGLFLSHVKERLHRDAAPHGPAEGALRASLLGDGAAAPDALLTSVLAHPLLLPWDRRFTQPCSTASAAASVLLSLSSPLPGRGHGPLESPERPLPESPALSESRLLSLSRSAVLAEVASAEMSLHAIYIHELHLQQQQSPVGLWVAAGAPKRPLVTTGSAARASQLELREMPLGGWAEEDEEDEDEEEEQTTR